MLACIDYSGLLLKHDVLAQSSVASIRWFFACNNDCLHAVAIDGVPPIAGQIRQS